MRGKKRCLGRKGISPLIATVLLIAFAVALGAMIMNWSSNLLSESRIEGECGKAKLSLVGKFCFKDNHINLEVLNSGETNVEELVLKSSGKDVESETKIKDSRLSPNQRLAKQIPYLRAQDNAHYEIIPSLGAEGNRVKCDKSAIKLDRLEDC